MVGASWRLCSDCNRRRRVCEECHATFAPPARVSLNAAARLKIAATRARARAWAPGGDGARARGIAFAAAAGK